MSRNGAEWCQSASSQKIFAKANLKRQSAKRIQAIQKNDQKRLWPYAYGLKSLIHECRISTKKTTLCSKRKARTSWDIHTVTRNAHQLYDIVSSISAQKIHFARPNGDSTFIQTSHSHKMLSSLCQLSWAICSKRSPRSVLAIVQRERLFKWWWRKRCFDFGRFLHVKRVMRARWGVFASPNLITWKSVDWSGSIKGA